MSDGNMKPIDRALFHSIWLGDFQTMKDLLARGADPNALDEYTKSRPIHVAARYGLTNIVEYLIREKRVVVNRADRFGRFPIDYAHANNFDAISELISQYISKNIDKKL